MTTSTDEFLKAIDMLNQPFPTKVSIASSYSLPIFNTGMGHWHIVDAAGTGDVVASVFFMVPNDLKDRMAQKYMKAVEERAERIAEIINIGLGHEG